MSKEIRDKRKKVICDLVADELYVPMKEKELAVFLQVPKAEKDEFKRILEELLAEGKLSLTTKGKYMKSNGKVLVGTFISNAKGFGFVEVEGREEDYYIPEDKVNGAFHKDTVQIALLGAKNGKRQEAQVVKIISRGMTQIVGTYEKSKNFGFVVPDNGKVSQDIFVPKERSKGAVSGHKVVVEITDYGSARRSPEGKVVEILGHINDPGVDIMAIVRGYELPMEFGEKVLNQAERVSKDVSEADMEGRKDLRNLCMVTIDGEDAKDLDDAVSIVRLDEGYRLGVHIADVSHYVTEGSPLDEEAKKRGTSVYLTDRVVPMLPHRLSNGICSLNQGEDRLALSCIMEIDKEGNVTGNQIAETLIRVDRRMTYTAVNAILEASKKNAGQTENDSMERTHELEHIMESGLDEYERSDADEEILQEYAEFVDMFLLMKEAADILRKKRRKRGSIDFDLPESKIILDEKGQPIDIHPYVRNQATDIIEDFMLIANETVAEDYFWQELPFVYRTHEKPDPDKVKELAALLRPLGAKLKVNQGELHPKELQKLLASIADSPEETFISRMALRSMKQARYGTECIGHFGLAAKYYCHFTSPIRRYPDLQIHRIIKENLNGRLDENRVSHYDKILQEVAAQSSKTERRAVDAERTVNRMKMAQYMRHFIGEVYEGMISGVTKWGMYVELPNTVEGLVHVNSMEGDYYQLDEVRHELVGESSGRTFRIGQPVRILVAGVDLTASTIDFVLTKTQPKDEEEYNDSGHNHENYSAKRKSGNKRG